MSKLDQSHLDGTEWVLRTRVQRSNAAGATLTHDASIHATSDTRAKWNAHFWSLFPNSPNEFNAVVLRGEVNVAMMFRFRGTIKLKEDYGGIPVLKVARASDARQRRAEPLPESLASAVEDYERDKRRLEEQRRKAWLEVVHLRLPTPPAGYRWELQGGDPRAYADLLQFRLVVR